ncbi:hypothetical protein B0H13DRAFT_1882251 [Mycena leptocephala]|nr:hypothetical protein B0H13DRAFT_1882251 [Mycena leptocephala]
MRRARSVEAMRSQPRPRGPASRGATGTPRSSLGQMAHGETGIPAGGRSLMSKRVDLPDAQLKKEPTMERTFFAQLRPDAQLVIGLTPRRGHRQKQQNTAMTPPHPTTNTPRRGTQSITHSSFSPARMTSGETTYASQAASIEALRPSSKGAYGAEFGASRDGVATGRLVKGRNCGGGLDAVVVVVKRVVRTSGVTARYRGPHMKGPGGKGRMYGGPNFCPKNRQSHGVNLFCAARHVPPRKLNPAPQTFNSAPQKKLTSNFSPRKSQSHVAKIRFKRPKESSKCEIKARMNRGNQ